MDFADLEKRDDARVAEWFKDHVVKDHVAQKIGMAGHEFEMLIWKQPGTSTYRIHYCRLDNVLMVSGDVGEAVYAWSEVKDLRWISQLDTHYFAGKCQASEYGRGYRQWNRERARIWLENYFKADAIDRAKPKAEEAGVWNALCSRDEWAHWLMEYGYDAFEDISDMGDIGMEISLRCRSHLAGLRMAFERMPRGWARG